MSAYDQGREAGEDGRLETDNPYDAEDDRHEEWSAGWHDATPT